MTARPTGPGDHSSERREHGLVLADALLARGRELLPLPAAAHARVKRRLVAGARRRIQRRVGWLRPAVIASLSLICGGAFGVALDRVILKPATTFTTAADHAGGAGRKPPGQRRARASATAVLPEASVTPDAAAAAPWPATPWPASQAPQPAPAEPTAGPAPASAPAVHATSGKLALPGEARQHSSERTPAGEPSTPVAPFGVPTAWPSPAPVVAPAVAPAPAPAPAFAPAPAPPPPVPVPSPALPEDTGKGMNDDRLSEERLLAAAVRALRTEHAPRSALAALDQYRARYGRGRLFVEAEVLRVDALAALGDTRGALRVLDGLDFAQLPGGTARQVQRGELRAAAGRQREAEADFDGVLLQERGLELDVLERALWGRAQSRSSLGDTDGARHDASEYLRRYPHGRFASAAARLGPTAP